MNDINEPVDDGTREVSLLAVSAFAWRHRRIILLSIGVCAIAAAALAFAMKPKYRAEVVFSPVNSVGSFAGELSGSLGGLAALAGITLGGAGKGSEESLEYLRSRQFTREFIERHKLMPVLFAGKWDSQAGRWRGEPPTTAEGVDRFSNSVRQITEDHRTGIVTLAIIWRDRVAAAEWANAMIAEADAALRQRAIAEYNRSLDYLKEEARSTSLVEMQSAVDRTMETELKDAMLARTRDEFAFRVLDPAVIRDPKDIYSPNKPLIIAVGAGLGLVAGLVWAAVRQMRAKRHAR